MPIGPDPDILSVQVLLDRLGFSSGVIDGRKGQPLRKALRGFQQARGIPITGMLDGATRELLKVHKDVPGVIEVMLTRDDLAGPFIGRLPSGYARQAKLPMLGYQNRMEALAEKFHTTPHVLLALNSPSTLLAPGLKIRVPNVVPDARAYPADLTPEWRRTLASLNVSSNQPRAARIIVDKSDKVLMVMDAAGQLVAQFPVTTGSRHDPLPLGRWKILGTAYNPPFHYNPDLFWDAGRRDSRQLLKPGPNGPVGVVWLDLSKPHYGIHGTPKPELIGRTESHGCIRLTNWDAARLALMVKPGTPALFRA
nr:L,D-transpeptidase family protein [Sphingomonas oleivorans]